MHSKHILLTGANGFIGSHLLERLLSLGYRVTIVVRHSSDTKRIANLLDHASLTRVDTGGLDALFSADAPDTVIHLATCYRKYHTATDIDEMISSNVTFPTQLAQLCVSHGVRCFINTGTFFEYDFSDIALTEQSREKAFNLYASTKQSLNSILRYYTEQYDFRVMTLRLFSPYGPRDNEKLIPVAIRSLIQGTPMNLQNATQKLSFTYVDDIVDAYMLAIEKIPLISKKYDVVNIAPQEIYSLGEVLHMLEDIAGKKLDLSVGEGTEADIWHSSFGSHYAQEVLGWVAKTSLREGLTLTYHSYNHAI